MAEREQRGGRDQRGGGRERKEREERDSEFVDKLVHINRVAKVVKGGKRFGFAALVVIGDQKGRVGYGHGKAREVPEAIRKATESAKRNLTRVALREGRWQAPGGARGAEGCQGSRVRSRRLPLPRARQGTGRRGA